MAYISHVTSHYFMVYWDWNTRIQYHSSLLCFLLHFF